MYSQQARYEEQLKKVGLRGENDFTCTCYLDEVNNTPKEGDILCWAESSAVVYANSVLGARCNRNSGMIDIFSAIIGKVPEFGFLLDEGRKADWIIEVKTTKGDFNTPFYLSDRELEFSKQHKDNYYLYRVYDYSLENKTGKIAIIKGSMEEYANYPIQYRIALNKK